MTEKTEAEHVVPQTTVKNFDLNQLVQENQVNADMHYLESELRMTLEEIARLQKALADANMKISALESNKSGAQSRVRFNQEYYGSLAKELEQPISRINEYCNLLLGESVGILGTLQRKFVERIAKSANTIQMLVDDLSETTKPDHANVQTTVQYFSPSELLDPVLNAISDQLRSKQITLGLDINDDLPDLGGDREELQQIVQLLLTNAVLATPEEGSIQISIQKEMDSGNKFLHIRVQNSGVGIKREEIEQLFTYRLQENDQSIPGLGLKQKDLILLRMLVEEQNGKIDILSDILQGTAFILRIPLIEIK